MAAKWSRSSSGTKASTASIRLVFPAAEDDWMMTASGSSSFLEMVAR